MTWFRGPLILILSMLLASLARANGYLEHPQARALIDELVAEEGFDRAELEGLFAQAERKDSILKAIARPAEKTKPWYEYRAIFVTDTRTRQGLEFYQRYAASLQRAEREFGIPAELIVAVIGVETRYGRNKGSFRVLDALSTLAFDYPRRSPFLSPIPMIGWKNNSRRSSSTALVMRDTHFISSWRSDASLSR